MKRRALLLSLLAVGTLAAARPATAKVQRVQKDPDRVANYCAEKAVGSKCAPIATGDLNGDGKTDAVFLRIGRTASRTASGISVFGRNLDILFGPFAVIGNSTQKADVSVTLSSGSELPSIAVDDFDGDGIDDLILAEAERVDGTEVQRVAVLAGGPLFKGDFFMGAASRGNYRLTRELPLSPALRNATAGSPIALRSRLSPRMADVNGDSKPDLLLAVDPATLSADLLRSSLRLQLELSTESPSHVLVFLDAPDLASRSGSGLVLSPGDEDIRIEGLGACTASSLLGTGEVTADGQTDIIVRRCPGGGVPDMLGLVSGRRDWPASLTIDGAVQGRPNVLPPGPEPTAAPGRPDPGRPPGRPEDPPRGYVAFSPLPKSLFDRPSAFFIQDVNQDGVADLGFGFSDKTHIWLGGRNLAARVKANHSDRVYLQAGFGGTSLSGSWRVTDITGDKVPDLILTQRSHAQEAAADRPVPAPIVLGGGQTDAALPDAITGGGLEVLTEPVKIYAGARTTKNILNLAEDEPDAIWQDPSLDLWLIGDFNGDGQDDLMMGSPGQSGTSAYQVYFGPFTN